MRKCLKRLTKNVTVIWLRLRLRDKELKNFQEVKYGFHGAIAKINRKTGIGYRVIPLPECGEFHVIFTLDELSTLRRSGSISTGAKSNYRKSQSQTHRFGVFYSGSDGRLIPKHIWDIDLYGDRSGTFPRNASRKAIAGVAWRTLRLSHRPERSPAMTWSGQVRRMNWVGVMEQEIRWYLADSSHELKEEIVYASSSM